MVSALKAAGVNLKDLVDVNKLIRYLAENGINELGEMPELSEEFSKK